MKYLLFFLLAILVLDSYAQPGCTDPQALNFDSGAVDNDGSCTYGLTEYALTEITLLPDELNECSGLEWLDSGLWIHNDAGNEDKIYRIDSTSGEILQSVIIATADNIDWEEVAEDEDHIYIGDFGNNVGNRTDLRIFRIKKTDLIGNVVNADLIEFEYSDQIDFTPHENDNNFDCEAFIYHNDSLHLFTKNWVDSQTKHYVIPATPGSHSAELVETFNVNGLLTGADISINDEIVLIGYTEFGINFMWILFDFQESLFFSGNKRRISLGTGLTNSQTEGITFRGDGYGYICSERFKVNDQITLPQKLLSFSIKQWVDNLTNIQELDETYRVSVFPNPFHDFFNIELSKPVDQWQVYDSNGRLVKKGVSQGDGLLIKIEATNLPAGTYFFEMKKGDQSKTTLIVKQ